MNHKALTTTLLALSMLTSQCAFAQGNDNGNRNRGGRHENAQGGGEQMRDHKDSRKSNRGQQQKRVMTNDGWSERGAGPDHAFHRGGRLPYEYRATQYVVDDWRAHRLNAPPRGYHWVQTGGDYVLVGIATGIILQLLLSN